jgi:hypothetical protein
MGHQGVDPAAAEPWVGFLVGRDWGEVIAFGRGAGFHHWWK